ncbi:MAG: hypothetical protein M3461_20310 [Pseudomonadota bacterium]|nr:hypothetical protein [Pseudomonadota bacterium]
MSSKEQVVQSILEVAREMNESLARRIDIERGEDAPLFGKEGVLESLGLVSFIVAVEQAARRVSWRHRDARRRTGGLAARQPFPDGRRACRLRRGTDDRAT